MFSLNANSLAFAPAPVASRAAGLSMMAKSEALPFAERPAGLDAVSGYAGGEL